MHTPEPEPQSSDHRYVRIMVKFTHGSNKPHFQAKNDLEYLFAPDLRKQYLKGLEAHERFSPRFYISHLICFGVLICDYVGDVKIWLKR